MRLHQLGAVEYARLHGLVDMTNLVRGLTALLAATHPFAILVITDAAPHLRDVTVSIRIPQTLGGVDLRRQQDPHTSPTKHQAESLGRHRAAHLRLPYIQVEQHLWRKEPLESLHLPLGHRSVNETPTEVENTIVSESERDRRRAVGKVLRLHHGETGREISLLQRDQHHPTVTEITSQEHHRLAHQVEATLLPLSHLQQALAQLQLRLQPFHG